MNLLPIGLIALLCAAGPDWLVTRDGGRIETRGPWKVKGLRVVFQLPNGTLSAVRVTEIDLAASRALLETPAEPKPVSETQRSKSALTIGPKDIPSAVSGPGRSENAAPEVMTRTDLHISSWRDASDSADAGIRLRGTLLNNADTLAAALELQVALYDRRDQLIDSRGATIEQPSLDVGRSCEFEAFFPGQFSYERVEFDLDSMPLRRGSPKAQEGDTSTAATPDQNPPGGLR